MNNGTRESTGTALSLNPRLTSESTELQSLKRDLLKAEVTLAKARVAAAGAEVGGKVLTARLRAMGK